MTALPHLAFPRTRARRARSVALSLLAHAVIVAALVWHGVEHGAGAPGKGPAGGGSGSGRAVNFFALAAPAPAAPAAAELPPAPRIAITPLPALPALRLDLPAIAAPSAPAARAGTGAGTGAGAGGAGTGAGGDVGSGTGGQGDYIFVASPRAAILPPLAKVPGTVAGRTYRIRFWVAADGRVTRVEIDPPMHDEGYRREFLDRMMAYQFYPARTRAGANIPSVVTVPLRIGN